MTDGVCKLEKTCCSGSAEVTFKTMTSVDHKQKIQNMLINALMPCHNHTFLGRCWKQREGGGEREKEREREREREEWREGGM